MIRRTSVINQRLGEKAEMAFVADLDSTKRKLNMSSGSRGLTIILNAYP